MKIQGIESMFARRRIINEFIRGQILAKRQDKVDARIAGESEAFLRRLEEEEDAWESRYKTLDLPSKCWRAIRWRCNRQYNVYDGKKPRKLEKQIEITILRDFYKEMETLIHDALLAHDANFWKRD